MSYLSFELVHVIANGLLARTFVAWSDLRSNMRVCEMEIVVSHFELCRADEG